MKIIMTRELNPISGLDSILSDTMRLFRKRLLSNTFLVKEVLIRKKIGVLMVTVITKDDFVSHRAVDSLNMMLDSYTSISIKLRACEMHVFEDLSIGL